MYPIILLTLAFATGTLGEQLQLQSNCDSQIYVQNQGGDIGPFFLQSGQSQIINVQPGDSTPRVWAYTDCDGNGNNCDTSIGENSLAEMHWDQDGTTWYDISQVDGYNLPITISPFNPNAGGNCGTVGCNFDMNDNCPSDCQVQNNNGVVACKSNNRDAVTDYSTSIKQSCPNVYSWSKDDAAGMRSCNPGNNGLNVIFC